MRSPGTPTPHPPRSPASWPTPSTSSGSPRSGRTTRRPTTSATPSTTASHRSGRPGWSSARFPRRPGTCGSPRSWPTTRADPWPPLPASRRGQDHGGGGEGQAMGEGAPADLVLTGGAGYTVDAARTWAQAVAISGGRITAVGTDAEMRPHVGPRTEVVNLRGRMVLPGFQDAHVHASSGGLERGQCDLTSEHTREGYLAAIRAYAERNPGAEWITGGGWGMDVFPGGVPSKEELDQVVPYRPVFLSNRDHPRAWVISRALALAGLDAATPDPPDGRIERTATGEPQGSLHEGAMNLVERMVPAVTLAERVAGVLEGQRYLHSLGITAWQE